MLSTSNLLPEVFYKDPLLNLAPSSLRFVVLRMIFCILNTFISIFNFSLYLLIVILCFLLAYKYLLFATIQIYLSIYLFNI